MAFTTVTIPDDLSYKLKLLAVQKRMTKLDLTVIILKLGLEQYEKHVYEKHVYEKYFDDKQNQTTK